MLSVIANNAVRSRFIRDPLKNRSQAGSRAVNAEYDKPESTACLRARRIVREEMDWNAIMN